MVFIAQNPSRLPAARASARWGTLGLALGAGLAAALLAFLLVRSHSPAGASASETLSVVVAAHAIPARTRLTAVLLQSRSFSASHVPEGAISTPAEAIGKITVQAILAGAAVTKESLAAPGTASGLAFTLPSSLRAVTIALDPADAVDEFAYPGDHVDILATDEPGASPAETRTVLQNVALLAVGAQTSADAPAAPTSPPTPGGVSHVTVAVSPAQAQTLVLAAARGKIHLALRAADDNGLAALPTFPAPPASNMHPVVRSLSPHSKARPRRKTPPTAALAELPPIPLSPLPVVTPPTPHPAAVAITVIKGSQSQTVSVAP